VCSVLAYVSLLSTAVEPNTDPLIHFVLESELGVVIYGVVSNIVRAGAAIYTAVVVARSTGRW
jgi:hypothetical protein